MSQVKLNEIGEAWKKRESELLHVIREMDGAFEEVDDYNDGCGCCALEKVSEHEEVKKARALAREVLKP